MYRHAVASVNASPQSPSRTRAYWLAKGLVVTALIDHRIKSFAQDEAIDPRREAYKFHFRRSRVRKPCDSTGKNGAS